MCRSSLFDRLVPITLFSLLLPGCRPPPGATLREGGVVNARLLVQAHPSWQQVAALDARIQGMERGVPVAAPIPTPKQAPVEAAAEAFPDLEPSLGLAERRELQELIQQRVEQDYEVLASRLDAEVRRYAAGQEAAALARAEEGIARRAEQFRSGYLEVVRRYADLLGPLLLLQIALMPGLGDTVYFPQRVIDERGRRRTDLEGEIDTRRTSMDQELAGLTVAFREDVAGRRQAARREAQVAAEQYRQARIETLRSDRERQRRALESDLERALQEANLPATPPIDPRESVFEGRREMAGEVARANITASRARDVAGHQRVAAVAALRQERQRLAVMIDRATRTLAESVAREQGVRVEWSEGTGDAWLTEQLLALLRARWAADGEAGPPRVGRGA